MAEKLQTTRTILYPEIVKWFKEDITRFQFTNEQIAGIFSCSQSIASKAKGILRQDSYWHQKIMALPVKAKKKLNYPARKLNAAIAWFKADESRKWLTDREAAEINGCSKSTIRKAKLACGISFA